MSANTHDQSTSGPVRRTRSPGYPSTNLRDALEKAEALWNKVGKHEAGRDVVAEVWNFSESSSAVPQYLAALKRYGLLEDVGDGNRRLVRLTPLSIKMIAHGPDSQERRDALKTAALKPSIFGDLMRRYGDNLSVSDSLIKSHLIVDLDFNKDVVGNLVKAFRETITFAGLTFEDVQTDTNVVPISAAALGNVGPAFAKVLDNTPKSGTVVSASSQQQLKQTPDTMRDFTLPMPNGGIYIRVPLTFSEADFQKLKQSLDLFKDWLVSPPSAPDASVTSNPTAQPD